MNKFKRGAEWRQWDLHIHTKSSYDYSYNNDDADILLCNSLKKEGICAVAISDHFKIDKERIKNLRHIAPEILFFPAVELRTDKGADNLHLILIFDDKINLDILESDFSAIMLREKIKGEKDENYHWAFEDIINFAKKRNAIITIHAGRKTNGLEKEITNSLPTSQAIKKEIAQSIDIFEMGQLRDIKEYNNIVFKNIQPKAMIMCSDNHNPKEYIRKEKLWIKADISFKGLEYAIKDPNNRIFIGDNPTKNQLVLDNQTKYIDKVKIRKIGTGTKEIWFDNNELQLNQDLVAIIGNKGNGKSALADIIAFNSNHKDNFSFLNEKKFRTKKNKLAENFESEVTWKNGTKITKRLDEEINSKIPAVKYIPQSYLEQVCNEIIDGKKSEFNIELEKVIFSHIPESDRLGYDNFEKLIEATTNTRKIEKSKIIEDVKILNKRISEKYKNIYSDNRKVIKEKLEQKKLELEALIRLQPKEVLKPDTNDEIKEEQEKLLSEIATLEAEKKKLINENSELTQKYAKIKIDIQNIHDILDETNSIKNDLENYKIRVEKILIDNKFDIKIDDILKFEIDLENINNELIKLSKEQGEISNKLSKEQKESITNRIEEINNKIIKVTENLNAPNKLYQKYEIDVKDWNDKISKIKGDINKTDTIAYYEEELRKIDEEYPKVIVQLEQERNEKIELIFAEINKEVEILKQYYLPVQSFIDNNKQLINDIKLKFDVVIIENGFKEKFLNYVSLNKKGTFNRNDIKINELLAESSFDTFDNIKKFIDSIINNLKFNNTLQEPSEMELLSQLKDTEKLNELLDIIYSLDYLVVQYELKLGDKTLNELSPGEKGLLLLIFYLLIDKENCPLIIDQPEENLDNDTITKVLVPCINEARIRRQIIMVTHNPNLAVVCDAEQIIYCEIDKSNKNKVTYESGSLENEKINKRVTDILEGTMKAFRIRDKRYIEQTTE